MSDYKKRLGAYGENLAADFLVRRNYKIIDRNFRTRFGEIDLIARQGDEILFVEVKTRSDSRYGFPELAVDHNKISHLNRAIEIYQNVRGLKCYWRLDIISIELNKSIKTARIRWIKDVNA